jgi:hypothetical protein
MLNDDGEDVAEELIRSSASDVDDLIIGRGCALLRYTGRIDAAEAPFVCHDGVAGILLIEGHLAVAGSGLASR